MFRILFGAAVFLVLAGGPAPTQTSTVDQESLAGFWETATTGSIDGLFLSFASGSISIYHRPPEPETSGGHLMPKEFDGRHLAVAGLDLTFQPDRRRWVGTLTRAGVSREVVLERPLPGAGIPVHPLAGDWTAERDPTETLKQGGSLHITQSYDGRVNAWMNRVLAPFDERRYGERLEVSVEGGEVRLRLTQYQTGPPLEYRGTVSPDGRMTGTWVRVGIDQPEDTWKLNAPTIFVRQP